MSMGILMVIMITIVIILYRRAKFEAELNAMNWVIKWEDVSSSMASDERRLSITKKVTNHPISPETKILYIYIFFLYFLLI